MSEKKDFFISYTQNDAEWALWIDKVLKNEGYTTIVQVCDAGFEVEINSALRNSECFIAVMSKEYQNSRSCNGAWTAAYKKDTEIRQTSFLPDKAVKPLFVPVLTEDIKLEGLLTTRVYVSVYEDGKTEKEKAQELLEAIKPRPIRPLPEMVGSINFAEKKDLINNLPYPRNPYFTGREEILKGIDKGLASDGLVALVQADKELAGVGKTAIASEYAYIHEKEYKTIWWVNAESHAAALDAFKKLAIRKQIVPENAGDKNIIEAMKYWFSNNKEWLFIYDGANTNDFNKWLEPFFPQTLTGKGHVIITTRGIFFPKCKLLIPVPVFSEMEAVSFLKKRTGKNCEDYSDVTAKMLSEQLQFLPSKLEQAAAYIEQTPDVTYQDCIALIKKHGTDVFQKQLTE